jgi:hypothetical protein
MPQRGFDDEWAWRESEAVDLSEQDLDVMLPISVLTLIEEKVAKFRRDLLRRAANYSRAYAADRGTKRLKVRTSTVR